jgi:phosphatidate cytidylyltransferase
MASVESILSGIDGGLKTRIRGGLIFGLVALGGVYLGGTLFTLLMAAAAAISVHEWGKMVLSTGQVVHKYLLPLATWLAALAVAASGMADNPDMTLWILLAFCFLIFTYNASAEGPSSRHLIFGVVYIAFSMEVMIWLRNSSGHGLYNMLTLLFIIWASDISAYFSGKTIGGPKLAPAISPKKTWAGFFGSSIGAAIVAAFLGCPLVLGIFDVATIGNLSWKGYAVMGFVLAMFGQAGDLLISMFKRHYGVKDTGAIIPGHGGLLDRIDALLLVALLFGSLTMLLK